MGIFDLICSFYGEFENEQKKDKFFFNFRSGDSNPRFSVIFPPMTWIFMEGEGDEIKLKQASKRDRTLMSGIEWIGVKKLMVETWNVV